jgi:hypothetical protein
MEPALLGAGLGDVDVEGADRAGLELALARFAALRLRRPRDAAASEAAVQRRAGQARDGDLERVEAVIRRHRRVAAVEGDGGRLCLDRRRCLRGVAGQRFLFGSFGW